MKEKTMLFILGMVVGAVAFHIGEKIYEKTKKAPDEESEEVDETEEEGYEPETPYSMADEYHIAERKEPIDEDGNVNYSKYFSRKIVIPADENDDEEDDSEDEFKIEEGIYGISPDEFGEVDGYDTRTLTYYADGVLTDSDNSIIEDPSELVGENWKDEFGKFEDDAAYIRNDYICQDFEILKDLDKYSTWFGNKDKGNE